MFKYSLEKTRSIKKSFIDETAPVNYLEYYPHTSKKPYGCVYVITNLLDGKRYVGQTIDFNRRAQQYIRSYNNNVEDNRSVMTGIRNIGIENFSMRCYMLCESKKEMDVKEDEIIQSYNTLVRENGYNERLNYGNNPGKFIPNEYIPKVRVLKEGKYDKLKKKSRPGVAINLDVKKIYFVDSLKLFGTEVINKGRDQVSHAARDGKRIAGYFVLYTDKQSQLDNVLRINAMYERNKGKRSGCIAGKAETYEYLTNCIEKRDFNDFIEAGFDINYIGYFNDGIKTLNIPSDCKDVFQYIEELNS